MDLNQIRLGHISYWILSMYLSSYPFMISQRSARRFAKDHSSEEERENFPEDDGAQIKTTATGGTTKDSSPPRAATKNLTQNLRELKSSAGTTVATEIGWLFLAAVVIAYIEDLSVTSTVDASPLTRILFEISSAYGTVGLSLASTRMPQVSYSGVLSYPSKTIILLVMYFGKFRGLPQTVELNHAMHVVEHHRVSQLRRQSTVFSSENRQSANFGNPSDTYLPSENETPHFTPSRPLVMLPSPMHEPVTVAAEAQAEEGN